MQDLALAQFGLVFWVAVCFFAWGARLRSRPMTFPVWLEVIEASVIVVLLFALLTEGAGCRSGGSTVDEDAVPCIGAAC